MNIAVVDDDDNERADTVRIIKEYAMSRNLVFKIDIYKSSVKFTGNYSKGKYNIIFSDIQMNDMDGFVVGQFVRSIPDYDTKIIYVTNYPEFMVRSFDVMATQFFSKPLDFNTFAEKMDIVMQSIGEEHIAYVKINDALINTADIRSIETSKSLTNNGNIVANLADNKQIKLHGRMKEYMDKCRGFIAISRSVLINVKHIAIIRGNEVIMDNGTSYSISRGKSQKIRAEYISKLDENVDKL